MEHTVRVAEPAQFTRLAGVLGRAFADDPVWSWIYPQPDRERRLASVFEPLMRAATARGGKVLCDGRMRAAAVWQPSDHRSFGVGGVLRVARALVWGRARFSRGARLTRELERRHPEEPHWYLALLGTDPDHQGSGIGSLLVRHVLDDPAHRHQAAYLETETEANVAYYHRFGFRVVDELDLPRGGPHMWLMWRDPPAP